MNNIIKDNWNIIEEKVIKPMYEDGSFPLTAADEITKALQKQISKKPKLMETTLVGEKFWWYCGHCGASRHTGSKANYCGYCGGKVDWGGIKMNKQEIEKAIEELKDYKGDVFKETISRQAVDLAISALEHQLTTGIIGGA